jgi:hypothetical protein
MSGGYLTKAEHSVCFYEGKELVLWSSCKINQEITQLQNGFKIFTSKAGVRLP